jgi:peroxiredoxin
VELPRLKSLYEKYRKEGFQLIAIDQARDTDSAKKFIRDNSLPYQFVENGEGKEEVVQALFGIDSFPTSYLIDRSGKIVTVHVGFDEGDETKYEKQISELLKTR